MPDTVTSRGGPVEEDSDEHEGTSARRGDGTGEEQDTAAQRCGEDVGVELPADKETLEALSEKKGAKGLQHRSAGRGSNRAKPEGFRQKVLQLVRKKYSGTEQERFGPTLPAEHLADEDGLKVGEETLRRWMLAEGLWSRMRRRKAHRKRRARREHFGDLVQLDGSFHAWFEERGPRGCLMNMVDDATGDTHCRIGEQETIGAAAGVLQSWIEKHGVPRALYTDWKNVYKREPTEKERLQGQAPTTQFGRMCASGWRFALSRQVRRKRKGGWSETMGCIRIAW